MTSIRKWNHSNSPVWAVMWCLCFTSVINHRVTSVCVCVSSEITGARTRRIHSESDRFMNTSTSYLTSCLLLQICLCHYLLFIRNDFLQLVTCLFITFLFCRTRKLTSVCWKKILKKRNAWKPNSVQITEIAGKVLGFILITYTLPA